MPSIQLEMQQHGIGHGGFHTERIRLGHQSVNMIYDCGTTGRDAKPVLKDAIHFFIEELRCDRASIDLLVLSHFDMDHVNGLNTLADECHASKVEVKTIWIPQINPLEKMIVALKQMSLTRNRNPLPEWYIALLEHPVEFLNGRFPGAHIERIYVTDARINREEWRPHDAVDDRPTADEEWYLTTEVQSGGRNGLTIRLRDSADAVSKAVWEFIPFRTLATSLAAEQMNTGSSSLRRILANLNNISLKELMSMKSENPEQFKEFEKAVVSNYGWMGGERRTGSNLSSLCLYSGPLDGMSIWCRIVDMKESPFPRSSQSIPLPSMHNCCPGTRYCSCCSLIGSSWLGTGDYCFKHEDSVGELVRILGPCRTEKVGIISAPHHGSKHDSSQHLWSRFSSLGIVTFEANYAQGMKGRQHPHQEVLSDILFHSANSLLRRTLLAFCIEGSSFEVHAELKPLL